MTIRSYRRNLGRAAPRTNVAVQRGRPDLTPPWYFHPRRQSGRYPVGCSKREVDAFRSQLQAISSDLDISWHPRKERWQVWVRDETIRSPWCRGWRRLFLVQDIRTTGYKPLSPDVFAELFFRDAERYGNGRRYYQRMQTAREEEKARRKADRHQETRDVARDRWAYTQIKVSMFGRSSGNKFSTHHAGE